MPLKFLAISRPSASIRIISDGEAKYSRGITCSADGAVAPAGTPACGQVSPTLGSLAAGEPTNVLNAPITASAEGCVDDVEPGEGEPSMRTESIPNRASSPYQSYTALRALNS